MGCGKHRWDGWVNCDYAGADVNCDIRELPFPDGHADAICAIHVFEHFYRWEAEAILKEWRRVLKSGGRLILELPSLDKVMVHAQMCMNHGAEPTPMMFLYAIYGDPKYRSVPMLHKWAYRATELAQLLKAAGFIQITLTEPRYHFRERDMRITAVKPVDLMDGWRN